MNRITKIFHIADIHCRLFKRHQEYKQVLDRLFDYIEHEKDEGSVIYLAGDIAHSKNEMSPELVALISYCLKRSADLCPTILILGNHDCNLNNAGRLDVLTPIVAFLQHPNLYYWRDTGVYALGDVHFSVMSVLSDPNDWVMAADMGGETKVALFHGPVKGATTDQNYRIAKDSVTVEMFEGFDMALLGDIHRYQFLNYGETVAYPGSLIQQNHGEDYQNHGLLVWDVPSRKAEFVPVRNDYAYYTFQVQNGEITSPPPPPALNLRARIKHKNTDPVTLKGLIKELRRAHNIAELSVQRVNDGPAAKTATETPSTVLIDVRDVEYQNELILKFLRDHSHGVEGKEEAIREINRAMNKRITKDFSVRHVVWRPKRFEFSNMFSYGEGNVIDFTEFNGLYGIFAPNTSGKSTMLDALMFCLFDKTSRTSKAGHILNNKKKDFRCRLEFELFGRTYVIERIGKQGSKGAVRVDVNFWVEEDGQRIMLNGADRDATNKVIREHIGTYDDFVLTALSTQNDNQNFIERTQKERKELLYRFLDIYIFEELYRVAKEENRSAQVLIKELERENLPQKIEAVQQDIREQEMRLAGLEINLRATQKTLEEGQAESIRLIKEMTPVSVRIDLEAIQREIEATMRTMETEVTNLTELDARMEQAKRSTEALTADLPEVRVDAVNEMAEAMRHLSILQNRYREAELQIKTLARHVASFEEHKYDPNCAYCVKNAAVVNGLRAEEELKAAIPVHKGLALEIMECQDHIARIQLDIDRLTERSEKVSKITGYQNEVAFLTERRETIMQRGKNARERLNKLEADRLAYEQQSAAIDRNRQLQQRLDNLSATLSDQRRQERQVQDQHRDVYGRVQALKNDLQRLRAAEERLTALVQENEAYELYQEAVYRDGVPYTLLQQTLPMIEDEVNNILNQLTDFTIRLETEDNNIYGYIVYSEENQWPIELISGMERFILSLAIRTSLVGLTALPKPNFIAIDEGFGVLDAENLNSVYLLFEQLRNLFTFVMCVSHLDVMRDVVDNVIEIAKVDGYSEIRVE
jgi:DNA repair exonuclease SbcCD ATPase subunit